jgi:hypothetical protein
MALDEDPKRCGYTEDQIKKGLAALENRGVKQLGSDAAHLYFLLLTKGLIQVTEHTKKLAKRHDEIVSLRFDKERSNIADIPVHIRNPLFKILSEYSEGSVQLHEKKWHTFTLDSEHLNRPYFLMKQDENK